MKYAKIFVFAVIMAVVVSIPFVAGFEAKKLRNENLLKVRNLRDIEAVVEMVPETYEEVALPDEPNKFLLWTNDIEHYMTGEYGDGFFTAEDNQGSYAWGIYGRSFFAGYYHNGSENLFYIGKYTRNSWKMVGWPEGEAGLFGLESARGGLAIAKPDSPRKDSIRIG